MSGKRPDLFKRQSVLFMRRAILLFLKHPEPGRVKTRLAVTLGTAEAAAIYRRLVAEVCRQMPSEGESILVFFDPPERQQEVESWLGVLLPHRQCHFHPQTEGDLGTRLERAFATAFAAGYERVAVVGSDCIEITPGIFAETWQALAKSDVVLGPAEDGGYYLLGLKAPAPELFRGIAWSSNAVLSQTLERSRLAGLHVSLLPELCDVDTEDDWWRAQSRLKP